MNIENFAKVKTDVQAVNQSIHSYFEYLNKKSAAPFGVEKPVRENVATYVIESEVVNTIVDSIYQALKTELLQQPPYAPLNIKACPDGSPPTIKEMLFKLDSQPQSTKSTQSSKSY